MNNFSDEPRSKPKIDPLEAPLSKEDELDALLKLNTTKKKKSNPVVYNFSEPIENLHLGLSSSGKDFSRTTTNTAKKGDKNTILAGISLFSNQTKAYLATEYTLLRD